MARSVPGPESFLPCIRISPESGLIRPSRILRKVLLPQPDGPTIDTNSPSATSISKLPSAGTGARLGGRKVRLTLRPWIYATMRPGPDAPTSAALKHTVRECPTRPRPKGHRPPPTMTRPPFPAAATWPLLPDVPVRVGLQCPVEATPISLPVHAIG